MARKLYAECFDEPFSDPSQIPTYMLCKFVKKKITVAISGEGADELMMGYSCYAKNPADKDEYIYSDYTKKVTLQNLYNDGGYSSVGVSQEILDLVKNRTK